MAANIDLQTDALGFGLAMAIGVLVGRTRGPDDDTAEPPKPGFRDFVIIAMLGALCGRLALTPLTVGLVIAMTTVLVVMRVQHPDRTGLTTELSALVTFVLGYLSLTDLRPMAAALGILLAGILAAKEPLHQFALRTISQREFGDTLKFLALIFIIYPLLPAGGFGPFDFFEPRRIWLFVILVSGVSYVGYFLTKFLDPGRSLALTAVVGGLASTTAYTGGVSKVVAESPTSAVPMARAALLANSIQPPRLLVIIAVISPSLLPAALPALAAMMLAGLAAAWMLGRAGGDSAVGRATAGFKNPFSLWPALRFGLVFAAVLFLARAGRGRFGDSGQWLTSAVGGLVDVDAVLFSLADFFGKGETDTRSVVMGTLIAIGANALFKTALAFASRQPAFYWRLMAGFLMMLAAGAVVVLAM